MLPHTFLHIHGAAKQYIVEGIIVQFVMYTFNWHKTAVNDYQITAYISKYYCTSPRKHGNEYKFHLNLLSIS